MKNWIEQAAMGLNWRGVHTIEESQFWIVTIVVGILCGIACAVHGVRIMKAPAPIVALMFIAALSVGWLVAFIFSAIGYQFMLALGLIGIVKPF